MSEYDKLLAEVKATIGPMNEKARKEIVEYLLGRYTDEGLPLWVFQTACKEAIETIQRKEEEYE